MAIGINIKKENFENFKNKLEEIAHMKNRLEAALEMFCFIARTQMFLDGNKRVAQLMCNKIMMEDDIGIFSEKSAYL